MNNLDLLSFARRRKRRSLLATSGLLVSASISIILASQFSINLGERIEFGQGAAATSVCDAEIEIVPETNLFSFNAQPNDWPLEFTPLSDSSGRTIFINNLSAIGNAALSDAQWSAYTANPTDEFLLDKINYPFFYVSNLIIRNLDLDACDGKFITIKAMSNNSAKGPVGFINDNSILALDSGESILTFKINQNSPFGNFTELEPPHYREHHLDENENVRRPNPWIYAINADSPNPELWIDFTSGPKYLTQSIKNLIIESNEDTRLTGLASPNLSDIKSVTTGGFVKVLNYDAANTYSFYPSNSYIGDGVFYVSSPWTEVDGLPAPDEAPYDIGLMVSKESYVSRTLLISHEVYKLSTLNPSQVYINLGYARSGVFNESLCSDELGCDSGTNPRVSLFFEIINNPAQFTAKQICRDTTGIDETALRAVTGINSAVITAADSNSIFRGIEIQNLRPSCTVESGKVHYYRLGIFATDGPETLLAMSDEITIPAITDNTAKAELGLLNHFFPD